MNQTNESRLEKAHEMGYEYVCEVCGTIGTLENRLSHCEWSFIGTHGWKLIKKEELLK